jgi:hypothetical protein
LSHAQTRRPTYSHQGAFALSLSVSASPVSRATFSSNRASHSSIVAVVISCIPFRLIFLPLPARHDALFKGEATKVRQLQVTEKKILFLIATSERKATADSNGVK